MKIGIIGGGAAGIMAAATIIEESQKQGIDVPEVLLFEKNPGIGRKVIISGGGRCNVTTGIQEVREVLQKYPRGKKFLNKALYHFPPTDIYEWFEAHGVPLKTEADMRVFPVSDDGKDIVRVFEELFAESASSLHLKTGIVEVIKQGKLFMLITSTDQTIEVDKLIITTGGQAYRHTGSTGDGYAFAERLGHTVTKTAPSLNSFILSEKWTTELSGVSFENIVLTVPGHKEYYAEGPIVFTHQGMSGPAVFALSAQVAFENYTKQQPLAMHIDFVPDMSFDELRNQIKKEFEDQPKRFVVKTLQQWLPKSVLHQMMMQLDIEDGKNAECSKKNIERMIHWIKKCEVHAIGRGAGSEFVTAGGVELKEVNPKTMESKVCPGLFFAGEVLNVDGVTGGFNLSASWAAGRLAGLHAAEIND